jgi:hypothetical protein
MTDNDRPGLAHAPTRSHKSTGVGFVSLLGSMLGLCAGAALGLGLSESGSYTRHGSALVLACMSFIGGAVGLLAGFALRQSPIIASVANIKSRVILFVLLIGASLSFVVLGLRVRSLPEIYSTLVAGCLGAGYLLADIGRPVGLLTGWAALVLSVAALASTGHYGWLVLTGLCAFVAYVDYNRYRGNPKNSSSAARKG